MTANLSLLFALALGIAGPRDSPDPCASSPSAALAAGAFEDALRCAAQSIPPDSSLAERAKAQAIHDFVQALLASGRGASSLAQHWATVAVDLARAAGDPALLVKALRDQGGVELAQGRSVGAAAILRSAVDLAGSVQDPTILEAMLDLADAASRSAQIQEALEVVAQAEPLARALGDEHSLARAWEIRAFAYRAQGDATSARPSIVAAVALRERLAAMHPHTALAYQELGELLTFEGRHEEARDYFRRTVGILTERLGPNSPRLARAWGRLGGAQRHCGNLAASIEAHQKAVQIAIEQLGPEDIETTARLNDFAITRVVEGDYSSARQLYEQALERSLRLPEPERSQYAATMTYNLGEVAALAGDLHDAYNQSARAGEMWRASVGPGHPFVALALEQLAAIERRRDLRDQARQLLDEALTIRLAAQGPEHPATVACARQAGELAVERLDVPSARAAASIASRATTRAGAIRPEEAARIHTLLARVAVLEGVPPPQTLATALDADDLYRTDLRRAVRYLAEEDGLRLATDSPRALDLALAIAAAQAPSPELARRLFDAVVRSRGLVLDTTASRARAAAAAPDEQARRRDLDQASRRLARLLYQGPVGPLDHFLHQVEEARQARDRAERDLALANADFRRELAAEAASFGEVAAALPADTALVSFVRYEPPATGRLAPEAAYAAFVTRRGGAAPLLVPLGAAADLDGAIETWRAQAHNLHGALRGQAAEAAYRVAARQLTERLWQPVARAVDGVSRVFVVADGSIQLVGFAALPTTGSRYLLETGPPIHYLAAERDLLRLAEPPPPRPSTGLSLLALGAPAYDASDEVLVSAAALERETSQPLSSDAAQDEPIETDAPSRGDPVTLPRGRRAACGELDQIRFASLPQSGIEARAVADLWTTSGAGPARVLTGAAATAIAFAALAPGRQVLHVATHGFALGSSCQRRGVARTESPMLLSGLAFAGANRRQRNTDDGILTAEEIAALPLAGVDWVVLSACDTGQGQIADREGVLGLRRAFAVAGARTLIASLWQVDDAHARAWMIAFYTARLSAAADTVEAATTASLTLLHDLRSRTGSAHPALWASWVTSGDWR